MGRPVFRLAARGVADEVEERLGEGGGELRVVAVPRDDDALGVELALEDVADRLVGRVMRPRDDERRDPEAGQLRERDLRLPRPALADEGLDALLELGRERAGRVPVRPDRGQEAAQEGLRLVVPRARVQRGATPGERRHRRIVERDARARRLDHRERPEPGPRTRGCEEADDAAVGVADEVVAVCEPLRDPVRVRLEVDVLDRAGGESWSLEDDELGLAEDRPTLLAPGRAAADDAPVDEHDTFHRCHKGRAYSARRAE